MRKQREVQVPSQVAHSTPTPVLKYVQVHLSLELGARGDFSCYTACFTPFPAQPSPAQPNRAHFFPPRRCLVGEVQRWRLPSSSTKQHVWDPPLRLRERVAMSEF